MRLVLKRLPRHLGPEVWRELRALEDPENWIPILTLIALLGMLTGPLEVVMSLIAGGTPVLMSLAECLHTTAQAATPGELDEAADELAQAIIAGGVATFLMVMKRLYVRVKGSASRMTSPIEEVPPLRKISAMEETLSVPKASAVKESVPPTAPGKAGTGLPPPSGTPLMPILFRLRRLPYSELAREIRRVTGDQELLRWKELPYGEGYDIIKAGPETAERLGVRQGDVIGYHETTEAERGFKAITGLDGVSPEEFSPYGDVFEGYGPAAKAH